MGWGGHGNAEANDRGAVMGVIAVMWIAGV
jgi:hypothetical protein